MEFIITFLIIFSISANLVTIFKKKIEQTIPICVMGMILCIYFFAIFEFLDIGIIVIEIVSLLSLYHLIKKIIEAIKEKNIKELLSNIITPGLVIYTVLYIVFIIINHRAIFVNNDEFNHWGIIIKNMFTNHSFGMKENSVVKYNEYPPFTAIFQYIFLFFKGKYNESTIITASNILYLSMIITIIKNIEWGKQLRKLIIYIPIILFLPMICYIDFYKTIIVDGILGIFFLYILYTWYTEKDDKLKKIGVTLGCCSIALIKLSGIGLSIIAFLIGAGYILKNKENRKKELKNLAIMLGIIIICIMSWQIKLKMTKAHQTWDMSNINIKAITEIPQKEEKIKIIKNYISNIFNKNVITSKNITTFVCLIIIIVYSIFEIMQIKEKEERKKYSYYNIALLVASIIYMITLLLTYLFIIPSIEAFSIPSFDRYIETILLPIIMFNIILAIERRENIKKCSIVVSIIILLIILPTTDIITKTMNWAKEDTKELEERETYAGIEKYKDALTKKDKIYFMGNGIPDIYKARLINNYLAIPTIIGNTEVYTTGHISIFKNIIKDGKYTHIYVFNTTENYREKFKELFKNEEMKNKTLYKIEEDGLFYEVEI